MMCVVEERRHAAAADGADQPGGVPLVDDNGVGVSDECCDIGLVVVEHALERGEGLREAREGRLPVGGQEVRARPSVRGLEHANVMAEIEELAYDAPREVGVAVVPVARERVDEERDLHPLTASARLSATRSYSAR